MSDVKKQLDSLFDPQSVAFIGASNDGTKWGGWMIRRALRAGYRGPVYPVNPREKEVQGIRAYETVLDIPGDVELAVITVPALAAITVMEDCVQKGVKAAVVISAGFAETGDHGRQLQDELLRVARKGNIRFMGPNCMGHWSATARLSLAFYPPPTPGPLAFVSQSGTFGAFLMAVAGAKGYGFSRFISAGNQADLAAADYLEYLNEDPETKAIVLYLEGVKNGRRFIEVAREVIKRKPIVLYKAGRTSAGQSATLSHTGSLSGADEVFDAVCHQVGILRAREAVHTFDMAEALSRQPLPRGKRVGIVTPGGGFCVTTADYCGMLGLTIPRIDPASQDRIKAGLMPHAAMPVNPVDTGGDIRPQTVPWVAEQMANLDYVDGIISTTPLVMGNLTNPDTVRALANATETMINIPKKVGKPLILSQMRGFGENPIVGDMLRDAAVPVYDTPEDAARAMYALMYYGEVQRRALGQTTEPFDPLIADQFGEEDGAG